MYINNIYYLNTALIFYFISTNLHNAQRRQNVETITGCLWSPNNDVIATAFDRVCSFIIYTTLKGLFSTVIEID